MTARRAFEELDRQDTSIGELTLRRRLDPALGVEIFEVKLGEEYLMSDLFTAAEEELAHLAIAALAGFESSLDLAVGGLGLGHTVAAALEHSELRRVDVIELLPPVIEWHSRGLVPLGNRIATDDRCHFYCADFFACAADGQPLVPGGPGRYHAVVVDIDHSPSHHLNDSHARFYSPSALRSLRGYLHPGGVFALWSDDPPEAEFVDLLASVFQEVDAHPVEFPNPLTGGTGANTIYLARRS